MKIQESIQKTGLKFLYRKVNNKLLSKSKSEFNFFREIKRKELNISIGFWASFTLFYTLHVLTASENINYKLIQSGQFISIIGILFFLPQLINFKIENKYLKFVYYLYCLWFLFLIISGIPELLDYNFLKKFIFKPGIGLGYFAPLLLLIPYRAFQYKILFNIVILFGVLYVILSGYFIKYLFSNDPNNLISQGIVEYLAFLSFPCGFILLTFKYHNTKKVIFSLIVVLLSLFFAILRARRGLIFMDTLLLMSSFIIFLTTSRIKLLIIYLLIVTSLLGSFYISQIYKVKENKFLGFLSERGGEDTRTGIELYLYDDFKINDWIFGRGIKGEYFCPDCERLQETNYRSIIETGYLQTILNGGLISLILFLLISLPAVVLGLFFSSNLLSKAASIWVLLGIISSYPYIVASFSLNYLCIWICIGICYSRHMRKLNDSVLVDFFKTTLRKK